MCFLYYIGYDVFIQCSPHPRKRKSTIPLLPENNGNDADPQASSSKNQTDAEFVQVGYDEITKRSPQLQSEEYSEKDPLLEDANQQMGPFSISNIKSEPTSEDDDSVDNYSTSKKYLDAGPVRSNSSANAVMVSY